MDTQAEFLEPQNCRLSAVNSQVAHVEEHSSSRDAVAQIMDVEMAAMSSALCFFRARHDAALPVSILPHDVLFLVFSSLACEEPPAGAKFDRASSAEDATSHGPTFEDTAPEDSTAEGMAFKDTDSEGNEFIDSNYVPTNHEEPDSAVTKPAIKLGWIKVTHVCRQWRQVVLQHASLWGDNIVSTLGKRWLKEMVARSRSAPMSLIYDQLSARHCRRLSKYMPRVHRLWLIQPAYGLSRVPPSLIFPVIMLDTLRVSTSLTHGHHIFLIPFPLPPHLFANAPCLRRLILDGYETPQSPLQCANLMHLEVYGHGSCFSVLFPLLDSLRHMTSLKRLVLEFCLPPSIVGRNVDRVPMPHLESLTLAGLPECCAKLMRSLIIPASVQLNLKIPINEKDTMRARFFNLLPCVSSFARTSSGLIPLRTLLASRLDDAEGYLFRAWHEYCPPGQIDAFERRNAGSPQITIAVPIKDKDDTTLKEETIIPDFIGALATPELRALCVKTLCRPALLRTWMDILSASPELQHIRMWGSSAITICEALATTPDDISAAFILPELQLLELQNVHFGLVGLGASESFGELLPNWIAWRQSRVPLSRLAITECHVEEECIGSLREMVDVDWDGRRGEYDSDWYECSEESGSETDASWSDEDPELAQLVLDVVGGNLLPDN